MLCSLFQALVEEADYDWRLRNSGVLWAAGEPCVIGVEFECQSLGSFPVLADFHPGLNAGSILGWKYQFKMRIC